jgi:pimeloyl-ACP methyl ester carboxylesterase
VNRKPELHLIEAHGEHLAAWDWAGEGPPLLFAHATGFHGRCWDRIIERFPERRCIAIDTRGHGHSSKPAPPYHWRAFGPDLAAIADHLGIHDALGIGHSMGGHSTVQCAALRPETYGAVLLVDPTIFPEEQYGGPAPDAKFTLRRKNRWTSADEMFERFKDRAPFAAWDRAILRDYCDYGILPDGDGYVLACPPPVEASIYENSKRPETNIYPEIALVRHPVVVMRAERTRSSEVFDLSASPTSPALAGHFRNGCELVLPDASHFIPMEHAADVAAQIAELMRAAGQL